MFNKNKERRHTRRLGFEAMEGRRLLAGDVFQHNADMPADVNNDHQVTAVDALAIINHLNRSASESASSLPRAEGESAASVSSMFLDVNGDNNVSAMDALSVINALNRSVAATPLATPTTTATPTADVDVDDNGIPETKETPDANETNETVTASFGATLMGPFTETAIVKFEVVTENGVGNNELEVAVRGASPNANLNVKMGGIVVGQVATDANGTGSLVLATTPSNANELPLPADFPAVAAGTTVQIGTDLSGTLAVTAGTSSDGEEQGEHDGQQYNPNGDDNDADDGNEIGESGFVANLAGTGNESATVHFETELERGTTETELNVSVRWLAPSSLVDVIIGGVNVGQLATDASGNGRLELSNTTDHSNDVPLPANFPTIAAGTTVQVGTLTGAFVQTGATPTVPDTPVTPVTPTTTVTPVTPVAPVVVKDSPPLSITPVTTITPVTPVDPVTPVTPVTPTTTNSSEAKLVANLVGTGTATVTFESELERGLIETELNIQVGGQAANATLDVTIDGVVVGQVATDAAGRGRVEFTDQTDDARDLALPANLPAIATGTTVQVGTLTGTFAAPATTTPTTTLAQLAQRSSHGERSSHHGRHH